MSSAQSRITGEFKVVAPSNTALDQRGGGIGVALRFAVTAIVTVGLLFPTLTALTGQLLFPAQARGSLVERNGVVVGSTLVAQPFVADGYFQPRPSAASYDPKALAGSNWAPGNPALRERIAAASAAVAEREHTSAAGIPSDLVTASGSGIDPHISPAAAALQVSRVAQARGLDPARVTQLVASNTQAPTWGILGQARVNVLQLNLALDALNP
jgi:potassium-transporting ATPase KdpC subunit